MLLMLGPAANYPHILYLPTLDERRNKAVACRELDIITRDQSHIFHQRL